MADVKHNPVRCRIPRRRIDEGLRHPYEQGVLAHHVYRMLITFCSAWAISGLRCLRRDPSAAAGRRSALTST